MIVFNPYIRTADKATDRAIFTDRDTEAELIRGMSEATDLGSPRVPLPQHWLKRGTGPQSVLQGSLGTSLTGAMGICHGNGMLSQVPEKSPLGWCQESVLPRAASAAEQNPWGGDRQDACSRFTVRNFPSSSISPTYLRREVVLQRFKPGLTQQIHLSSHFKVTNNNHYFTHYF